MRRTLTRFLFVLMGLLIVPAAAYAQASITGVVRDPSGAVLPGVTVEAASPALIEKVRAVATDGPGQYRIVDLRPGTYAVTFTLPGFRIVRREGIELDRPSGEKTGFAIVGAILLPEISTGGASPTALTYKRAFATYAKRVPSGDIATTCRSAPPNCWFSGSVTRCV